MAPQRGWEMGRVMERVRVRAVREKARGWDWGWGWVIAGGGRVKGWGTGRGWEMDWARGSPGQAGEWWVEVVGEANGWAWAGGAMGEGAWEAVVRAWVAGAEAWR